LNIPDPNKPPFPYNPATWDDDRIKVLLITVETLMKKVDELEDRIRELERERR